MRERDELHAFSKELESNVRRLARERDEARAAFAGAENSLTAEREHSARLSRECQERHDELRAEVERLRGVVERLQQHYAELVRISCLSVAERQREACAKQFEGEGASVSDRGNAKWVRATPLATEGEL